MNLYEASSQWSKRPDDERFSSLAEMLSACQAHKQSAREVTVGIDSIKAHVDGDDVALIGKGNNPARLTHFGFGQVARMADAPAGYLRTLPTTMVVPLINHGLARCSGDAKLLIHKNGNLVVRSITTESYGRIWNADVIQRLLSFENHGWRVPPARPAHSGQKGTRRATEADVLRNQTSGGGLSVKVGDLIAPAGLYASDHDMFVFMVNEDRRIADGTEGGLSRGFFISNTEVGGAALHITAFLYRHCCGNHILWNVSNVSKIKIVHRGEANVRFRQSMIAEIAAYADAAAGQDEARILAAKKLVLGTDKEKVLDMLFKHLRGDVSQKVIENAYERAVFDYDNGDKTIDPRTAWGWSNGATALSQESPFADERVKIDKAAAKVMQLAF